MFAIWGAGVHGLWLLPVLLFIVWMTNLYNFMDGSDGLAAGMALFGFSFYGIPGLINGNEAFAMINFSVGAAALGFLYYNFHPARVFMGDAGSIPLGFLAAGFGVWGWQLGYWPFWYPILVFSSFVIDSTVTLLKRVRHGENLVKAHRGHYYQRLVQMGWGHRNTAIAEYALMLLTGMSALWGIGLDTQGQVNLLVCWCAVYLGLATWIDRCWRKHEALKKRAADV
jgi:UDP-GlcNAc:undecaprenyl-phosphate/decaprenyl-phosphate GlcNAc-1-phosphate transferase